MSAAKRKTKDQAPTVPEAAPSAAELDVARRLRRFADDNNKKHVIQPHGSGSLAVHRGVSISTALAEELARRLEQSE